MVADPRKVQLVMQQTRASGILAHPTSFPGPHGIGDLGEGGYRFVEWLAQAGQQLWQVLPLCPIGPGNSPYASPSAFAGNPLLVSLDWLNGDGLLTEQDLREAPEFPSTEIDFDRVQAFKLPLLQRAFDRFRRGAATNQRVAFDAFCRDEATWLDDYALFMAVKEAHDGVAWIDWDPAIALRQPDAMATWSEKLHNSIRCHKFIQFQFRRQWSELRQYAARHGIQIVGDLPIFVAYDSADVWAHRDVFRLDEQGRPEVVAGVPPDAFTDSGQFWGNPLFNWSYLRLNDYGWWIDRVRAMLAVVDIIRIDHFRGFAAAWTIPAGADTAAEGRWERGPGTAIFEAMQQALGKLPFLVEDLGLITRDVPQLRLQFGLPGMKVLQFAFDSGPGNAYLPHNYEANCVVYPGTHDNQTTIGWFQSRSAWEREEIQRYLGRDGSDIAWDLIRLAFSSVAATAIVPLQDAMRLGDEARMNTPGRASGNWRWRYMPHQLHLGLAEGLNELTATYGRRRMVDEETGYDPFDYSAPNTSHHLYESDQ
ncbi:MAG: 4-alpha-glucanotransferase [Chloroflexia bacterium]|nr:4-alpha-glucanotransferase [Chloroflexia bacterium]